MQRRAFLCCRARSISLPAFVAAAARCLQEGVSDLPAIWVGQPAATIVNIAMPFFINVVLAGGYLLRRAQPRDAMGRGDREVDHGLSGCRWQQQRQSAPRVQLPFG